MSAPIKSRLAVLIPVVTRLVRRALLRQGVRVSLQRGAVLRGVVRLVQRAGNSFVVATHVVAIGEGRGHRNLQVINKLPELVRKLGSLDLLLTALPLHPV